MKLHPTHIQESSKPVLKKAATSKVYQDTLVYHICQQILLYAQKDQDRGYAKLATLWLSVEDILQNIENDIAPNEEIRSVGTDIGKLRYDVLFQVLDTLPPDIATIQLKTTVKAMFLLSKKFMQQEFAVFPPQI